MIEPPAFGVARGDPEVERLVEELDQLWGKDGPTDPAVFLSEFSSRVIGRRVPPEQQLPPDRSRWNTVLGQISGNLLLGMNAHVNRDLPFVLAGMGLYNDGGSSRKPDHDKVNVILSRVEGRILAEASRRFDSSIFDSTTNGTTLDETALYQTLAAWREEAWRNAERLAAARTRAERATVAGSIEDAAALEAEAIAAQYAYAPPVTSASVRDAYCEGHWADPYP